MTRIRPSVPRSLFVFPEYHNSVRVGSLGVIVDSPSNWVSNWLLDATEVSKVLTSLLQSESNLRLFLGMISGTCRRAQNGGKKSLPDFQSRNHSRPWTLIPASPIFHQYRFSSI